jgi:molybdopterin-guanine dinucleotide biosynthesis protein B
MVGKRVIIPIISILGRRGSGKTRLVERLIRALIEAGYRVGYAKHSPHDNMTLDTQRKDTWRGYQAGAEIVVGSSPSQTFVVERKRIKSVEDLVAVFGYKVDVILVEGFSDLMKGREDVPKVIVAKDAEVDWFREFKGIMAVVGPSAGEITNLPVLTERELEIKLKNYISSMLRVRKEYGLLPGFDCGECGFRSCLSFAEALVEGQKSIEDCKMLERGLSIKVDDKPLRANEFVQSIMRGAVLGMASSLKDVSIQGDESVEISIKTREGKCKHS